MLATLKRQVSVLTSPPPSPLSSPHKAAAACERALATLYCRRGKKAHRTSRSLRSLLYRFQRQSNDTLLYGRQRQRIYFQFLAQQHTPWISLFASALQSFSMIRHCSSPINNVPLFFSVFDPVCWRGRFASFSLGTVSKKGRLNIFWIREKMHPATDESATYAFGRSVTIRIQPPASLSLSNHFLNGYLQTSWAYCGHHINYHLDNKRKWLTESPVFNAHCRNIVYVRYYALCLQQSTSFISYRSACPFI